MITVSNYIESISTPKPWLEPIEVYESTGSGQYFASLVLKQQNRAPNSQWSNTFRPRIKS